MQAKVKRKKAKRTKKGQRTKVKRTKVNLALLVPEPTSPMLKMELCATVGSLSWENLLSVSRMGSWGFDVESRARAKGTALRITGSP